MDDYHPELGTSLRGTEYYVRGTITRIIRFETC